MTQTTEQKASTPREPVADHNSQSQPVDFSIIVAKRFLFHDGEIIQWSEIDKAIAALPNPKQARLRLHFTSGASQLAEDAMFDKVHELENDINAN